MPISSFLRLLFSLSPLLLFLLLAFPAHGATLAEYREKVEEAIYLADDLINIDDEELSATERTKHEKEILIDLRKSLPATENVEWKGNKIETDNKWLQDRLDDYDKEQTPAKRKTILLGINERLSAIEQKINELESPSATNRSKDEDKRKLGEILSREEYQKPQQKEESFMQKMWRKLQEWLSREAPDTPEMPEGASTTFQAISQILQFALYGLIFAAIGFLIYKFLPFVADRFSKREKREKKERVILGETLAEGDSAETIFSEAELLARQGNLRGAIRKGYVALLCELSDRKVIGLAQHKTNRDYLRDVRKNQNLHQNMNGLTNSFERHWYGFDEANENDWNEFKNGYKKAVAVGSGSRQ